MISEKMKELREKNGYTKAELSRKLEITQAGYDRYEKGTAEPNIKTILYLSELYNVSLDYLLRDREPNKTEQIEAILKDAQLRIINDVSQNIYTYKQ